MSFVTIIVDCDWVAKSRGFCFTCQISVFAGTERKVLEMTARYSQHIHEGYKYVYMFPSSYSLTGGFSIQCVLQASLHMIVMYVRYDNITNEIVWKAFVFRS